MERASSTAADGGGRPRRMPRVRVRATEITHASDHAADRRDEVAEPVAASAAVDRAPPRSGRDLRARPPARARTAASPPVRQQATARQQMDNGATPAAGHGQQAVELFADHAGRGGRPPRRSPPERRPSRAGARRPSPSARTVGSARRPTGQRGLEDRESHGAPVPARIAGSCRARYVEDEPSRGRPAKTTSTAGRRRRQVAAKLDHGHGGDCAAWTQGARLGGPLAGPCRCRPGPAPRSSGRGRRRSAPPCRGP